MARDPQDTAPRRADVLVIFGIADDLAKVMTGGRIRWLAWPMGGVVITRTTQ